MNKPEFVKIVANRLDLTQKDTTYYLNTILDTIMELLEDHESVLFSGFGKFDVWFKPSYEGIYPGTNKTVVYPERYKPRFTPSERMTEIVK